MKKSNPALFQFSKYTDKFKYPAKATHARYGSSKMPAGFEMWPNKTVLAKISSHNRTSQTNAVKYSDKLKNNSGQTKLKSSCNPYMRNAVLYGFPEVNTK